MIETSTTPVSITSETPAVCGCCGSTDMRVFYEVNGVPVHSVLLMPTFDSAVSYPRGNIRLACCSQCGFVSNVLFDQQFNDYNQQYEETQGFSPTFSAFHKRLVAQLTERYDIRNKQVVEIGCGKGEFLALICEAGQNQGIGFDPGYVPSRGHASANMRMGTRGMWSVAR
jgi:hypothetical protein